MAMRFLYCFLPLAGLAANPSRRLASFRAGLALMVLLVSSTLARGQFQQPFVFTAAATASSPPGPAIAVYARNDVTGVLTPVPGSPFPTREPANYLALDFKGRFLFVATSLNNIEMFTIDSNTGALQEVPNSPFASSHTTSPVFLSTESTGQFLYVVNDAGSQPNVSAVESFQIDAVNLNLAPTAAGSTDLPGLFVGGATHPSGKAFYVLLNNPASVFPPDQPSLALFNSSNGTFTLPNVFPASAMGGEELALDPQGRHIALGVSGQIISQGLQLDGTLGTSSMTANITASPSPMAFDPIGHFLYVTFSTPNGPLTRFYSPETLQELPDSPLSLTFGTDFPWLADPTAPLVYSNNVYQVDSQTGLLTSILSPDPLPTLFPGSTVFSKTPGSQPIQGPVAQMTPTSAGFGSLPLGQASGTQTVTIFSNGGQALSLNSLAIAGANPGDFSISSTTCQVPGVLQPGNACFVLLTFTPSAAGSRSAALTLSDNASPPTESVSLSGTGLAPAPVVTILPGNSIDFGTITEGTSTTQSITVKNSGNANLHITNVALSGQDLNDFASSSPTCNSPIAPNSACTVSITFTPLAAGLRTTTLALTDDAADSPQSVALKGNANPAFTPSPTQSSSTSATVSAGQTAQYSLQLTPGAGYSGTVSLTCSGAPLGAVCQLPSSVTMTNGAAAPFMVTVTTSGNASVPLLLPRHFAPLSIRWILPVVSALLLLLWSKVRRTSGSRFPMPRLVWGSAFAAILLCSVIWASGCGSASSTITPPPVQTPAGVSTIVITPTAMSSTGQPLQLSTIQLTLTVK
jgi:hypothetical protein